MKKLITFALLSSIAVTGPAFAQTDVQKDQQNIQSDTTAINKNNTEISNESNNLSQHRAAQAADKANGNYAGEAKEGAAIATDKTEIQGNKAANQVHKKVKKHHKKKLNQDENNATDPNKTN